MSFCTYLQRTPWRHVGQKGPLAVRCAHSPAPIFTDKVIYAHEMLEKHRPRVIRKSAPAPVRNKKLPLPDTAADFLKEADAQGKPVQGCALCLHGLHRFTYRDVLILRQFVNADGKLLSREETGVCYVMQNRLDKAIQRSRKAGLFPKIVNPKHAAAKAAKLSAEAEKEQAKVDRWRELGYLRDS